MVSFLLKWNVYWLCRFVVVRNRFWVIVKFAILGMLQDQIADISSACLSVLYERGITIDMAKTTITESKYTLIKRVN